MGGSLVSIVGTGEGAAGPHCAPMIAQTGGLGAHGRSEIERRLAETLLDRR